jgi:hypothetical protein
MGVINLVVLALLVAGGFGRFLWATQRWTLEDTVSPAVRMLIDVECIEREIRFTSSSSCYLTDIRHKINHDRHFSHSSSKSSMLQ